MATRAFIISITPEGARGVHLTHDGDRAFATLVSHYQEPDKVAELIAQGNLKTLASNPHLSLRYADDADPEIRARANIRQAARPLNEVLEGVLGNTDYVIIHQDLDGFGNPYHPDDHLTIRGEYYGAFEHVCGNWAVAISADAYYNVLAARADNLVSRYA